MTEYWKSNAKHWCMYCRVFIVDNKVNRRHHENGAKHKENMSQYIEEIRKKAPAPNLTKDMEAPKSAYDAILYGAKESRASHDPTLVFQSASSKGGSSGPMPCSSSIATPPPMMMKPSHALASEMTVKDDSDPQTAMSSDAGHHSMYGAWMPVAPSSSSATQMSPSPSFECKTKSKQVFKIAPITFKNQDACESLQPLSPSTMLNPKQSLAWKGENVEVGKEEKMKRDEAHQDESTILLPMHSLAEKKKKNLRKKD